MRVLVLSALSGSLIASACAPTQTADPGPVMASQADLARVRQAITPCLRKAWVPGRARPARATLKWRLDEDGRLVGAPEIIDPPGTNAWSAPPAAEAALRAVSACEPFRLPPDKYHLWKEIVFNFSAS